MKLKLLLTTVLAMITVAVTAQTERMIAFPGAEGFGRFTTGGRGGKVYHVTTLEDNGKTSLVGSFRWANAQTPVGIEVKPFPGICSQRQQQA